MGREEGVQGLEAGEGNTELGRVGKEGSLRTCPLSKYLSTCLALGEEK